jgi:hypothetical protein
MSVKDKSSIKEKQQTLNQNNSSSENDERSFEANQSDVLKRITNLDLGFLESLGNKKLSLMEMIAFYESTGRVINVENFTGMTFNQVIDAEFNLDIGKIKDGKQINPTRIQPKLLKEFVKISKREGISQRKLLHVALRMLIDYHDKMQRIIV